MAAWTCPCGEKVPVSAQRRGSTLVFTALSWADLHAHIWTHKTPRQPED